MEVEIVDAIVERVKSHSQDGCPKDFVFVHDKQLSTDFGVSAVNGNYLRVGMFSPSVQSSSVRKRFSQIARGKPPGPPLRATLSFFTYLKILPRS